MLPLRRFTLIACLLATGIAAADELEYNVALTPVWQGGTALDDGGKAGVNSILLSASVDQAMNPGWSFGLGARLSQDRWSFESPTRFDGKAPWGSIRQGSIGFHVNYLTEGHQSFSVVPTVEYAAEQGASGSDAIGYGATFIVAQQLSETLQLGIGAGVYREFDKTSAFPFLIVDWQIDKQWHLGNPFDAGPSGPGGLELSYAPTERWQIAAGGAWRSERFRLSSDNQVSPGGVGQHDRLPVYLRVGYAGQPGWRIDAYAAAAFAGKLKLENDKGNDLASDHYDTAPMFGISFSGAF
ncbi:hypothetical protein JHS3_07010 [Jeongeupia sp. HS-3]|uniref:DUF6268 family outer membrane beta-barrel protein n=1 Tax=Jeongeupia sp. HS-3 TaxID=1009682 RepID=UPI0018A5BD09|nr:DUF6268 family outer membrane beta-barrel protein [Jeongeupia sp. HS-3]BCL74965.1 hypothetical protein JHS3_07010 [Jeongeupia sp. HS-3]